MATRIYTSDFFPYERCAFRRDFLAAAIVAGSRQMQWWWWHTLVVVVMKRDEEILGRNLCKDEICLISGCRLWRELLLLAIDEE
jgi:hypothetical protein